MSLSLEGHYKVMTPKQLMLSELRDGILTNFDKHRHCYLMKRPVYFKEYYSRVHPMGDDRIILDATSEKVVRVVDGKVLLKGLEIYIEPDRKVPRLERFPYSSFRTIFRDGKKRGQIEICRHELVTTICLEEAGVMKRIVREEIFLSGEDWKKIFYPTKLLIFQRPWPNHYERKTHILRHPREVVYTIDARMNKHQLAVYFAERRSELNPS